MWTSKLKINSKLFVELGIVLSHDEGEQIMDDRDDLDNEADDLDEVDVSEALSEHLGAEDLDEPIKDKENMKVSFAFILLYIHSSFCFCCLLSSM